MVQAVSQRVSFEQFIAWYPENSEQRYELYEGVIVEMPNLQLAPTSVFAAGASEVSD